MRDSNRSHGISLCYVMLFCVTYTRAIVVRSCERSSLTITCPEDLIDIHSANYGRTTGSETCPGPVYDTSCYSSNSLSVVQSNCQDQVSCTVAASNSVFGDPCVGTVKYLEVDYTCGDEEDPVITGCPGNQNANTDEGLDTGTVSWTAPNATDNSGAQTLTSTHNPGDSFPIGATIVTYTSTDAAGNMDNCSFIIFITDNENPVIFGCPGTHNVQTDNGVATANVTWTPPTATDNSGSQTLTSDYNPGDSFPIGATIVTYSSTDAAGNMDNCTFVAIVTDTFGPTQQPDPVTVEIHPSNRTGDVNTRVELDCAFNNVLAYEWYKDGSRIPNTINQRSYVIGQVTPRDIGYYFCRGTGVDSTVDTNIASVYVKDVSKIRITDARFQITFTSEMSDRTTQAYIETSNTVSSYLETGFRNSNQMAGMTATVICDEIREGSVIVDVNTYLNATDTSAFDQQTFVEDSLASLAGSSDGFFDSSLIIVQSTATCENSTWTSPNFGLVTFPFGEHGDLANSSETCPFDTTNAYQPIARALCDGDLITQSTWYPDENCGPFRDISELLIEISETELEEEMVMEVSEQVNIITTNIEAITADDISLVSQITSEIADLDVEGVEVTFSVTSIVSNIASVDVAELEEAEESDGSVSLFVEAFEQQLSNAEVTEGDTLTILEPNVAVQIQTVPQNEITEGLVFSMSGNNIKDLTTSNIGLKRASSEEEEEDDDDDDDAMSKILAQAEVPPSVLDSLQPLPSASPGSNDTGNVRLTFNVYSTPALFISSSLRNISAANEDFNRTVNSPVVSLVLGEGELRNLDEFINFTFTLLETGYTSPKCVFWDSALRDWASEGCMLIDSSSTDVVCGCNHLTNFAVLMDIHREEDANNPLTILSYIGCGISVVCLIVTLCTYLFNKKLRNTQHHQIFICLCGTLLGLYASFLVLLLVDSLVPKGGGSGVASGPCSFLAGLVHFLLLSSIAWMGVEGYNAYLVIVRVFKPYIPHFMKKAMAVAWGIPAFIVILTGAIARENYAQPELCFLQMWSQIGGLLIPMAFILIANIIIFILVINRLIRSANFSGRVKQDTKAERRVTIQRVQNAVCILLLLGLTWTLGYLLLIRAFGQVVETLFIILNSFQGLFIFLLYCVRKPSIRKQWVKACCGEAGRKSDASANSHSAGTVTSMTSSTISGPRARPNRWKKSDNVYMVANPTYTVEESAEASAGAEDAIMVKNMVR